MSLSLTLSELYGVRQKLGGGSRQYLREARTNGEFSGEKAKETKERERKKEQCLVQSFPPLKLSARLFILVSRSLISSKRCIEREREKLTNRVRSLSRLLVKHL